MPLLLEVGAHPLGYVSETRLLFYGALFYLKTRRQLM